MSFLIVSYFLNSGKDMLVKFWDLDTRHCFKTLVNHRTEVNDLMLTNAGTRLLTGCHDNELRVFELSYKEDVVGDEARATESLLNEKKKMLKTGQDSELTKEAAPADEQDQKSDDDDEAASSLLSSLVECRLIGSIVRESKDALAQLCLDNTGSLFGSHSANEKQVEIYKINTDEEIMKRLAKRLKKQKRKLTADQSAAEQTGDIDESKYYIVLYKYAYKCFSNPY